MTDGVEGGHRTTIRVDAEFDATEWLRVQNDETGETELYRRVGGADDEL